MKRWTVSLAGLFVGFGVLLTVSLVKGYPQGEIYLTGVETGYANRPSPSSNPFWVRLFQDQENLFYLISVAGLVVFAVNFPPLNRKSFRDV